MMKKKKILLIILGIIFMMTLTISGCKKEKENTDIDTINKCKAEALVTLEKQANPTSMNIKDQEIEQAIKTYYDSEKVYINNVNDLQTAQNIQEKITTDTQTFLQSTLKPLVLKKLKNKVNLLIVEVHDENIKIQIEIFYNQEIDNLNSIDTIVELINKYERIPSNVENYIVETTKQFISSLKAEAIQLLDKKIESAINKVNNEELKKSLQAYYDSEKTYINDITDIETAKKATAKIIGDTSVFLQSTFKPLVLQKIDDVVKPLIAEVENKEMRELVQSFYNEQLENLTDIDELTDLLDQYTKIVDDSKKFINDEITKILNKFRKEAITTLDTYLENIIEKIAYEKIKEDIKTLYKKEIQQLETLNTREDINRFVTQLKTNLTDFVLTESKKIAISELEELVDMSIKKMPNEETKKSLKNFVQSKLEKLNEVDKFEDVVPTLKAISQEIKNQIKEFITIYLKPYIDKMIETQNINAYDYLPQAMTPIYQSNLVTASSIAYDFTNFTEITSLNKAGYGEQWQMVIENINQGINITKLFNVIQSILVVTTDVIDNYIASPSNVMECKFNNENYEVVFILNNDKLTFNINVVNETNIPVIGTTKPIINMTYDIVENVREIFISLSDSNKIKYIVSDAKFEMAVVYGIQIAKKTATRTSYLSIEKDSQKTTGHIYEYTNVESSSIISSSADFYIENGYVSVVGNKASGMIVSTNYINELYLENEGRLIGYEVRENIQSKTYNTLWFNLWDIAGINTIKVTEKTDDNTSKKSTVNVYINDSTTIFAPTYNWLGVKTSRKYDIEYRRRYYYTYDPETQEYTVNEILIPMMFIQEGANYESFVQDMLKDNSFNVEVKLKEKYLNKILDDYDKLIDIFITNKDAISSDAILNYLK